MEYNRLFIKIIRELDKLLLSITFLKFIFYPFLHEKVCLHIAKQTAIIIAIASIHIVLFCYAFKSWQRI